MHKLPSFEELGDCFGLTYLRSELIHPDDPKLEFWGYWTWEPHNFAIFQDKNGKEVARIFNCYHIHQIKDEFYNSMEALYFDLSRYYEATKDFDELFLPTSLEAWKKRAERFEKLYKDCIGKL